MQQSTQDGMGRAIHEQRPPFIRSQKSPKGPSGIQFLCNREQLDIINENWDNLTQPCYVPHSAPNGRPTLQRQYRTERCGYHRHLADDRRQQFL